MSCTPLLYIYATQLSQPRANTVQTLKTIEGLSRHFRVRYLATWARRRRADRLLRSVGVRVDVPWIRLPIPFGEGYGPVTQLLRFGYATMAAGFALLTVNRRVFTRDIALPLVVSVLPPRLRHRLDITLEMHKVYSLVSDSVSSWQERRAVKTANRIVATGAYVAEDLNRLYGLRPDQVAVVPNGVDVPEIRSIHPATDATLHRFGVQNGPFAVYVGSLADWKGAHTLVEAASHFTGTPLRILILGGNVKDQVRFRALVKSLDVDHRVVIGGAAEWRTAISLAKRAAVATVPNTKSVEGDRYTCPVKLLEYLACGLPIVAADLPSLRSVLTEPRNCSFFAPGEPHSLANSLQQLMRDGDARKRMAAENSDLAPSYDWSVRAQKISRFLSDAPQSKPASALSSRRI